MRTNRRRNWLIKRIALGFAIAAFAAPVAQARIDEGIPGQPNSSGEVQKAIAYRQFVTDFPSGQASAQAQPSDNAFERSDQIALARGLHRSIGNDVVATDYGMPRALPSDYAQLRGDEIELIRSTPRWTSSDKIEFVRSKPRLTGEPQVVATGFDWKDAGIGAGLALALVLLGGGAVLAARQVGREQTA